MLRSGLENSYACLCWPQVEKEGVWAARQERKLSRRRGCVWREAAPLSLSVGRRKGTWQAEAHQKAVRPERRRQKLLLVGRAGEKAVAS